MPGVGVVVNRDDDVAFDAGRPRRRFVRKFARRDPVGPVGEERELLAVGGVEARAYNSGSSGFCVGDFRWIS
jgi:hypothetical protein